MTDEKPRHGVVEPHMKIVRPQDSWYGLYTTTHSSLKSPGTSGSSMLFLYLEHFLVLFVSWILCFCGLKMEHILPCLEILLNRTGKEMKKDTN